MHRVTRGAVDLVLDDRRNGWIVFVGERFPESKSLLTVMEHEFGDFEIVVASDISALFDKDAGFWRSTRLVVMDCKLCSVVRQHRSNLKELFPDAIVAIAYDDRKRQDQDILASLDCELARGFLPMNLQLEIWLSAIRLMLNGGDYMPMEIYSLFSRPQNGAAPPLPKGVHQPSESQLENHVNRNGSPTATRISDLTERELDVLRLASQGHQNKVIAVKLGISEHTIKLHMHRVISKLGAHNRTEAAAAYLNGHAAGSN